MSFFEDITRRLFLPDQASNFADVIDKVFYWITMTSVFFFVLIMGISLYFVVKYRRRENDPTPPRITHNTALEVGWTITPTIIVFGMFYLGASGYADMMRPPANAMEIDVVASQWKWEFKYGEFKNTQAELVLPLNQPVIFNLRSNDVLHSFFIPSMRVKNDVIPGRETQQWFTPTKAGKYTLFCAEYCGDQHSLMTHDVLVVGDEEFQLFLESIRKPWWQDPDTGEDLPLVDAGKKVFHELRKCNQCHSDQPGEVGIGPSLHGIWGKTEEMDDGRKIEVDEEYFKKSLVAPSADVLKGYPKNGMTPFIDITDKEFEALVAFLKSLK